MRKELGAKHYRGEIAGVQLESSGIVQILSVDLSMCGVTRTRSAGHPGTQEQTRTYFSTETRGRFVDGSYREMEERTLEKRERESFGRDYRLGTYE
jgi:hypothetical protein